MVDLNVTLSQLGITISGDEPPVSVDVASGSGQVSLDVSSSTAAVSVDVTGGLSPVEVNVGGSQTAVTLVVSGGIGPAAVYDTSLSQLVGVSPIAAGKNISISTTGGSYTISSADPPVLTVQGRTGNVVLSIQDVSASSAVHSHSILDVVGLQAALAGKQAAGSYALASHTHSISSINNLQSSLDAKAPATHSHVVADVSGLQAALDGKQASGSYATLVNGVVPSAQLPSFVDDVLEFTNQAAFPQTGESGKIYVSTSTGKVFRWGGSSYVEIVPAPGSTDAIAEGSTNLYFTNTRALAAVQSALDGKAATSHTHSISAVSGLQSALDGKAATSHTHSASNITGLANIATSGSASDLGSGTVPYLRLPLATTSVPGAVSIGNGLAVSNAGRVYVAVNGAAPIATPFSVQPQGFVALQTASYQNVKWQQPESSPAYFEVQASENGGNSWTSILNSSSSPLWPVASIETQDGFYYMRLDSSYSSKYGRLWYRVRAYTESQLSGEWGYSEGAQASPYAAPSAPSQVAPSSYRSNLTLNILKGTGDAAYYEIQYSSNGGETWSAVPNRVRSSLLWHYTELKADWDQYVNSSFWHFPAPEANYISVAVAEPSVTSGPLTGPDGAVDYSGYIYRVRAFSAGFLPGDWKYSSDPIASSGGGNVNLSNSTPQPLGTASAGQSNLASRSDHVHAVPVISYNNLTNVPSTFTPASHTHSASAVTSGTFDTGRLPLATYTASGAVIVGTGLSVSNGTISVTSGGGSGSVSGSLDGGFFYGTGTLPSTISSVRVALPSAIGANAGSSWSSAPWCRAAFGNGLFVIASFSRWAVTADGSSWTFGDFSSALLENPIYGLAFGNGIFVASVGGSFGSLKSKYATSNNGTSWTVRTLPHYVEQGPVVFTRGKFWIFGYSTVSPPALVVMSSEDGVNWNSSSTEFEASLTFAADVPTQAGLSLLTNGSGMYKSTNMTDWSSMTSPVFTLSSISGAGPVSLGSFNGKFLAGGFDGSATAWSRTLLSRSADGLSWTSVPPIQSPTGSDWYAQCGRVGGFMQTGGVCAIAGGLQDMRPPSSGGQFGTFGTARWKLATRDGESWAPLSFPSDFVSEAGVAGSGKFIEIGSDGSGDCAYVSVIS